MYRQYQSDDDATDSETDTSSVAESSESENEYDGTTARQRIEHDGRLQAMDAWRSQAHVWVNGPGRAPVIEGPGEQKTSLGVYNTQLKFAEKRHVSVLTIDSLDRDQKVYPLPTQMRLKLPRVYRNIEKIDIIQVKLLNGIYGLSAARKNTRFWFRTDTVGVVSVDIPDGTYTMQQLIDALTAALVAAGWPDIQISYDVPQGRVRITYTGAQTGFGLPWYSTLPASMASEYSEWGLGWNLGFGGVPRDYLGANTYVGTCIPRLFDDYIYLRMNDTEYMNTIDHTSLENTSIDQDSTGQIAHYFGKLLLNNFSCYAQTFIESPKKFHPPLGRLERLNLQWVNRHGQVLAGIDAASCDWHMTLRITEIQEGPTPTSSLSMSTTAPA